MKKFPIVLLLMILSLFVSVNFSYAEDGQNDSSVIELKKQQMLENKEKFKSSIEEVKKREEKAREQAKENMETKKNLIKNKMEANEKEQEKTVEQVKERMETKKNLIENKIEANKKEQEEVREQVKETREVKKDEIEKRKETEGELESDEASDSARSHMSEVAKQVNILLQTKEDKNGVGKKVKEVAIEQVKSQEKIAEKLSKMEEKKVWLKKVVGYDKEAVLGVTEEIDANRLRIFELIKLQQETTDKTEISELGTAINSLVEQNVALEDKVKEEMKNQGVWGWFRNLMKTN